VHISTGASNTFNVFVEPDTRTVVIGPYKVDVTTVVDQNVCKSSLANFRRA
jgi:hypothetical protein